MLGMPGDEAQIDLIDFGRARGIRRRTQQTERQKFITTSVYSQMNALLFFLSLGKQVARS